MRITFKREQRQTSLGIPRGSNLRNASAKRILFILLIAGLMVPAGLSAQKMYKEGTKVVFDLTDAVGISPEVEAVVAANNKVHQKLEIAPNDAGSMMDWNTASTHCTTTMYNGSSDWRLPTQRELMLMFIFKSMLENLSGSIFDSNLFWSATEHNAADTWYINFGNGYTGYNVKAVNCRVRCVREL